jgi:hypothetical protein
MKHVLCIAVAVAFSLRVVMAQTPTPTATATATPTPTATPTAAPVAYASQIISTKLEASHVLSTVPSQLNRLDVFNSKGSAQFILVMDAAALPSNGAVTLLYPPIAIGANTNLTFTFAKPLHATTGIVLANSSTGTFSLTIGSADCVFFADTQ